MGLRVTVESPLAITDFLDVKFNLNGLSYIPYKKPYAKTMYVNKTSIHPKTILKQFSNIINECLNKRSSKEENFLEIKNEYELIMKKCGYDDKLKFENSIQKPNNYPKQKTKKKKNNNLV